jgi:CPA1 family monovalent cation:H+ antiporter
MAEQVLADADRLIEGARSQGRSGYQRAARQSVAYGPAFQAAVRLHGRLRLSRPLARMTADRFEQLLSQRLILRDLGGFIDSRIRRIHGRRVADLLHELLSRRIEMVETALDGLRLQYPGYAEELERRFIRRTALRLEEREYTAMREDGLIGAEVHTALMQGLDARRAAAEERPRLDIALQRADLVRQFPLFADLDASALRRLGRVLQTRYVNAGEVIVRKDSIAKSVFFIASGAVEVEVAGQTWRLGGGEMFGQMAILLKKARRAEVRAIAPTTLLVLDEARFRRLLNRSAALQDAVRASAERRGIEPEDLFADAAPPPAARDPRPA